MSTIYDGPKNLSDSGRPPETRMQDAADTMNRIQRLIESDSASRSKRRALVKGLVDGNPPYRYSDLRNAGRADACNVNWRTAESYLTGATGLFYDVFSETPTFATVELDDPNPTKSQRMSQVATEEFQRLQLSDRSWDYNMQKSQFEMVLYGIGPLIFCDEWDWRPEAVLCRDLLVPDLAKADISTWEEAAILVTYTVTQLYEKIRDAKNATAMGWNVEATRRIIMEAHPRTKDGGLYKTWEWHQDRLKTASYNYASECSVIRTAHYFIREFPKADEVEGMISHVVVPEMEQSTSVTEFLYKKIGRFEKWEHIIHPMYYDAQGGGYHHSVTGLGVKMYSALEFQNRLLCHIADAAFSPAILFKPVTADNDTQFQMIRFGNYAKLPVGFDMVQAPVMKGVQESLMFNREVTATLASNLSTYRQNLEKLEGNPITATEVQQRASEQARLGKTQLSRYFNQLDWLYQEKYRRAVEATDRNLPGGKSAMEFQKRCKDRGVPLESLRKVKKVRATRIVGQGSEFLRQASLEFLMNIAGALPDTGRSNLISDVVASRAGVAMVDRYYPRGEIQPIADDQLAIAMLQISAAKQGMPPVITDSQNHALFAGTFLSAASEAMAGLAQGADPRQVLAFVEAIGPSIAQHINEMSKDPTRRDLVKKFTQQMNDLANLTDKLRQKVANDAQQQAQQMQAQNQAMNDQQLKTFSAVQDERRKNMMAAQDMHRKRMEMMQQQRMQAEESAEESDETQEPTFAETQMS